MSRLGEVLLLMLLGFFGFGLVMYVKIGRRSCDWTLTTHLMRPRHHRPLPSRRTHSPKILSNNRQRTRKSPDSDFVSTLHQPRMCSLPTYTRTGILDWQIRLQQEKQSAKTSNQRCDKEGKESKGTNLQKAVFCLFGSRC